MLKKFRKVTILALALVMIFAMSASAFAVTSWSEIWTAGDEVTHVQYDCRISRTGTYGAIDSESNQGEVYVEVDTSYIDSYGMPHHESAYDNGYEYAGVSIGYGGNAASATATYYFYAYVDTTGEEFDSDTISLSLE